MRSQNAELGAQYAAISSDPNAISTVILLSYVLNSLVSSTLYRLPGAHRSTALLHGIGFRSVRLAWANLRLEVGAVL